MKKNGFLLAEQTVKIVIALIVLGFLIFLLTSLYFSKVRSENQKKAEAILSTGGDTLKKAIEGLDKGSTTTFLLPSPAGWYLFSFTGESEKPIKCGGENCLCICDNVVEWWSGPQTEYCHDYGACIIVSNLKNYEEPLEIYITPGAGDNPTTLIISKDSSGIVEVK